MATSCAMSLLRITGLEISRFLKASHHLVSARDILGACGLWISLSSFGEGGAASRSGWPHVA
eukprot:8618304-Pyramimonas_sp.AAC.3